MAGNVPALDSNGNLVIDVFPDSVTLDTEVPTFIADFLSDALMNNTATRITVTLDGNNKLNFVVDEPVVQSQARITGDGTTTDPLDIADGAIASQYLADEGVTEPKLDAANAPTAGQVLSWDATAMRFRWIDGQGIVAVATDGTLTGDGTTGDELGLADDSVTEPKLAMFNTPTNGQVVSWDDDNSRLTWTDQNSVGQSITNVTFDFADAGDYLYAGG